MENGKKWSQFRHVSYESKDCLLKVLLQGSISSMCLRAAFTHTDPESAKSCLTRLSFWCFWYLRMLKLRIKCWWNWPLGANWNISHPLVSLELRKKINKFRNRSVARQKENRQKIFRRLYRAIQIIRHTLGQWFSTGVQWADVRGAANLKTYLPPWGAAKYQTTNQKRLRNTALGVGGRGFCKVSRELL